RYSCHCLLASSKIVGASPDTRNMFAVLQLMADLNDPRFLHGSTTSLEQWHDTPGVNDSLPDACSSQ
ncbi:MAG: hypothetical protein ABGZ53_05360, partial [Fuerstiella sp.]